MYIVFPWALEQCSPKMVGMWITEVLTLEHYEARNSPARGRLYTEWCSGHLRCRCWIQHNCTCIQWVKDCVSNAWWIGWTNESEMNLCVQVNFKNTIYHQQLWNVKKLGIVFLALLSQGFVHTFISWSVWFVLGGRWCPQQCMPHHNFSLVWWELQTRSGRSWCLPHQAHDFGLVWWEILVRIGRSLDAPGVTYRTNAPISHHAGISMGLI